MGEQTSPSSAHSASSAKPPATVAKLLKSDEKPKSKKRGGERRRKSTTTRDGKGCDGSSETQRMSFAESRMIQNCFLWPCSDDGTRVLTLGSGLLHNCAGYICGLNDKRGQSELYGSSTCQSCGKSAATHELCISTSWTTDERTSNPLSIISVASIVVASRNLRCVIGEYYPKSSVETQRDGVRIQKIDMLPPLNAILCSSKTIPNALDEYLGRILSVVKKMRTDLTSSSKPRYNISRPGMKIDSFASIPIVSDINILQEKVSALTKSVQGYKIALTASSNADNNAAAINIVESRLVAMSSCDSVYYRCYYDAVSSCVSTDVACDGSLVAAIIPHPPTYFSCPGLAWDVQNGGVESLRAYMGKCSDKAFLAALLDESLKQTLLKSWGLEERLSALNLDSDTGSVSNPLLTLWQSRFMETTRHVWCTQYSAAKSSIALNEASEVKISSNHSEDTQLILHQANSLSLELSQWRDSIRDYPAHFYAYATPTTEALNSISHCLKSSGIDQVLEAGAGTGYWSALLRRHLKGCTKDNDEENVRTMHAQVIPYDVAPPSSDVNGDGSCNAAMSNEYHGHVPAFMQILEAASFERALSSTSKSSAKTALLLCYPPPGSDMAQKALLAHMSNGGHTVIYVGEWQGLTGDKSFEALLQQNFFCRETDVVSLPLWGTDATYLTIWRRKGYSAFENGVISYSAAMGHCSVQDCRNHARRRCRYARLLQYCCFDCYEKHRVTRRAMLAIHMVRTEFGDAVYEDDRHFMALNDPFESGKMKRKKRKRSRH
ncbi:hypothetical protein ACHAWU_000693 [Discostella pseudostelligera]|uniref:Uncharacterized protein n=1 Tax=Discostella pseudostelligera TaxID=259834 RepID=A0ABD3M5Y7_9STRA